MKLTCGIYFLSHIDVNKLNLAHKEPFLLCIASLRFNYSILHQLSIWSKKQK